MDTNWSIYHQLGNDFDLGLYLPGPNAVEFIINHAEVSIAFVQEKKIPSVCSSSLSTIFYYFKLDYLKHSIVILLRLPYWLSHPKLV